MSNVINKTNSELFAEISPNSNDISLAEFTKGLETVYLGQDIKPVTAPIMITKCEDLTRWILGAFNQYTAENAANSCRVIGVFQQHSCILPIVEIAIPDNLGKITLRCGLTDTLVSCDMSNYLPYETFGLAGEFDPRVIFNKSDATQWDGFPENRIYGAFSTNTRQFTCLLPAMKEKNPLPSITGMCRVLANLPPMPPPAPEPPEAETPSPPAPRLNFGNKFKIKL